MSGRARLLLALVCWLLVATLGAAAPAGAQDAEGSGPALELVERSPWVPAEGRATFSVRATGDVESASVQVEVFSSLDSVDELEASATEDVGVRLSLIPAMPLGFLTPAPDGTYEIGVPVSADPVDDVTTQLVEPGIHPVVISLLDAGGEVVDQIRTPLVRLGDDARSWDAPQLAVVLDVGVPPTLQPDGTRDLSAPELQQLAGTAELLAAHPDLDLTIAAVPDTIDALAAVDDPTATTILEQLRGRDVLASPYLPLPVASLLDVQLEGLVPRYVDRGRAVLADLLATEPRGDTWEGSAAVADRGGTLLEELGYERILVPSPPLASDDVPGSGGDGDDDEPTALVDSGPRPVSDAGPLAGVVVDDALSTELAAPLASAPDAAHVELARLLLRPVGGDPGADRAGDGTAAEEEATTVVVRPGPLPPGSTLAGLLDLLDQPASPARVGGLDLVDDVIEGDESPVRQRGARPDLSALAPRVHASIAQIDTFAALIGERSARADDLRLQIATGLASDATPAARDASVRAVEEALGDAFGAIRLSGQTDLNLTSRRGTLPVTIDNGNPFPVDLLVRIRSDRLAFPDGELLPVTVDDDVLRIDVPVEALATGSVPVFVELWTPDDRVRLDTRRLNVRSTAVSGVGLVLSLGALAVLVVWWARHWRSTRRADRTDRDAPSVTPEG